jgi:large subunit ribosomal protein L33
MRELVILACTVCKNRNYTTTKNKRKHPDRLEHKKYCRRCGKHTAHKETR